MKSFNKFINEAKKDLPPNPGELTASEFEQFKRVPTTGEKPDTSSTNVNNRTANRRTRERINRTGRTIRKRTSAGTSWEGDQEAIEYAKKLEQANKSAKLKDTADTVRSQTKNPTVKQAASNILGGGRAGGATGTEELVGGKTAPAGTGQAFRDTTVPQEPKRTTGTKSNVVKQSEVSLKQKDYRDKFRRGTQGPSTKLRTPKQTEKYLTGVKKGYFDPKSGRVTEKGLQKHVSMRAVGGENFGKMKGADPRGELARVGNIVARAQRGDRAARSEIRRSYKSITKNYSPETGARTNPATRRSFKTFQQQVSNTNVPKLEPPKKMPIPSAPSTGSSSGSTTQTATQTATRTKTPTQNVGTTFAPTPTKGGELALATKPGELTKPRKPLDAVSRRSVKPPKRREVKIPKPLAPKKSQVVKNVEKSLSGAKQAYPKDSTAARKLVGFKQGGRLLGRALGPAMTAWDAYDSYKAERERGQTKERATKAAIATAGGGALGAWGGAKAGAAIGGTIGSIVPGAGTAIGAGIGGLIGGIGGYMAGSGAGKALLGASKKDKEWMSMTNRKNQAGTSATATTFKSGNKGIVRDADGKERVGYAAVKDGKTVYKTANDPKSLKYTSSNPLERLGRSTADAGIPFVSDFLKNRYAKGDEAARKRKVAAVKASATNK